MRLRITSLFVGVALSSTVPVMLAAQEQPPAQEHPSVSLPPDLDRVLRDYERAWRNRDAAGLAALFTDDGFVMSPGRAAVRGRSAIERRYARSGGPLVLRAFSFAVADNVGFIIGGYAREEGMPDIGKFVLALRRDQNGRWFIAADMDNGNQ